MKRLKANQLTCLLLINIIGFAFTDNIVKAVDLEVVKEKRNTIEASYLDTRNELQDYILDTGDSLYIEFKNLPALSKVYTIDAQGEIYLKKVRETFVRGLTVEELTDLLQKRYSEFLISPEIHIQIAKFKPIKVSVQGEVRRPGLIIFDSFLPSNKLDYLETNKSSNITSKSLTEISDGSQNTSINAQQSNLSLFAAKGSSNYVTTISNAINNVGGLTSYSDISSIQIIRDVPLGKGGGKKKAIIDFTSYLKSIDKTNDIRLFDGDIILIPRLKERNKNIVRLSILSGLSPRFINVNVTGKIESPGKVSIPLEGSLSDAMNLTGPKKPLAGKVFLIRYNKDGSLIRKNINYSANAAEGSPKNPKLLEGDLITVKNSILGRSSGTINALTAPLTGIYSTKLLFEAFSGN